MRSRRLISVLGSLLLALVILVPEAAAAPALTVTPTSGSLKTEFVAVLSGFTPRAFVRRAHRHTPSAGALRCRCIGGYRAGSIPAGSLLHPLPPRW